MGMSWAVAIVVTVNTLYTIWAVTMMIEWTKYSTVYLEMSANEIRYVTYYRTFTELLVVLGGYMSDVYFGAYNWTIGVMTVTAVSTLLLGLSATHNLGLPKGPLSIPMFLIACLGKQFLTTPIMCLAVDQFIYPTKYEWAFVFFYFTYYIADIIVTVFMFLVTAIESWDGADKSFGILFLNASALVFCGVLLLLVSRNCIRRVEAPRLNFVVLMFRCIKFAAVEASQAKEEENIGGSWLDYSKEMFGRRFVAHVKRVYCVILVFPLILATALFRVGSGGWESIASMLVLSVGGVDVPKSFVFAIPSMINIVLGPPVYFLFTRVLTNWTFLETDLRKVGLSLAFLAVSLMANGIVCLKIENEMPHVPPKGRAHFRFYNTDDCFMKIDAPFIDVELEELGIKKMHIYENFDVALDSTLIAPYQWSCGVESGTGNFEVEESSATSYYINEKNQLVKFLDDATKHPTSAAKGRILVRSKEPMTVSLHFPRHEPLVFEQNNTSQFVIPEQRTYIYINDTPVKYETFLRGGVYVVLVNQKINEVYDVRVRKLTNPNSINFLWIMPVYAVYSMSELLFFSYLSKFLYAQAPPPLKATILGIIWDVRTIGGKLITLIDFSHTESNKMFLNAVYVIISWILFGIILIWYEYDDTSDDKNADEIHY